MERYYLAADYAQSQVDSYTYDDSQLDAYYEKLMPTSWTPSLCPSSFSGLGEHRGRRGQHH